ncbi:ubiquitin-protein ligase [Lithospermum erythrorhizon]|uniref:E2 ubiquitin-conjugating enzyme n=1 Tax=Lithospermum erythrorhizon TaxID=34254 RepID=A0AAV3QGK8_LITER
MDSSDFDSSSESSGSGYQDDIEFMYDGHAFSILSNLEDSINKIDDFLSFERSFSLGEIVRLVTDPSGQMGRVVNVVKMVDIENIYGKKIQGVNSNDIQKIHSLSVNDYVVKGSWLGKVDKVVDFITVLFDNGTKVNLSTTGPEKITPLSTNSLEDFQYPFYPGQRVKVDSSLVSLPSGWLCGLRKDKNEYGTVCSIDSGLVYVGWLGCAMTGSDKASTPPCLQSSKELTLLSCFTHANWQVGDWCLLPTSDHESIRKQILYTVPPCLLNKTDKLLEESFILKENIPEVAVIMKTNTKVDVIWQDGSWSSNLDSDSLFAVNMVDAHDYFPNQFVLEKETSNDSNVYGARRWGVVRSVDATERTVKVEWITSAATDDLEEHTEEMASAYELVEHPDYSFCLGDAVFTTEDYKAIELTGARTTEMKSVAQVGTGAEEPHPKCTEIGGSQSQIPSRNYLSCIGIVVGFKDGNIEVKWASGTTSMVKPYQIYKIDNFDVSTSLSNDIEQSINQMAVPDNQSYQVKPKEFLDIHEGNGDCEKTYSLQQTAMDIFSSITSGLYNFVGASLFGKYEHVSDDEGASRSLEEDAFEVSQLELEGLSLVDVTETIGEPNSQQSVNDPQIENNFTASSNKNSDSFVSFDMVSGCLDHHFADGAGKDLHSFQVKNGWIRKVQQEWSILEKELPETIYVRVYEDRMDLLRAAIVGAPGTPYHDGLFFFDIHLPFEYPQQPPLVYYNSGGLRLNPNLYESGKVCLSLLNTWTGSGSEVWNPGSSNILQVLLSLQALVLNEKPYFNEAGYDSQAGKAEGEKNSISYNENAFLTSCKSMVYILRKPPQHFEKLVEEHFNRHSEAILLACKAYMGGALVGSPFGSKNTEQENQCRSSTGFKIMLAKVFPGLVEAFSNKGVDCSRFL